LAVKPVQKVARPAARIANSPVFAKFVCVANVDVVVQSQAGPTVHVPPAISIVQLLQSANRAHFATLPVFLPAFIGETEHMLKDTDGRRPERIVIGQPFISSPDSLAAFVLIHEAEKQRKFHHFLRVSR
jgi:precorrin-6B methylase 1